MYLNTLRSHGTDLMRRALFALGLFLILSILYIEPAFAQATGGDAFGTFESKITEQTTAIYGVIKNILYVAAGVALLVGVAPMLWGQVKVKWMVTGVSACVLFGLVGFIVNAFSGTTTF